jgi:hypothetical protein
MSTMAPQNGVLSLPPDAIRYLMHKVRVNHHYRVEGEVVRVVDGNKRFVKVDKD